MTRPVPLLAVGYRVPGAKKLYATEYMAYYAIAKRLVLEKYPPWIHDEDATISNPGGWTADLVHRRSERAQALFFTNHAPHFSDVSMEFCADRWVAFLRRLARFLRFVDRRRDAMRDLHTGLPPAEEHAMLERDYQQAEADAERLMQQAAAIRAEMRRRAG